jgi:hypothetical protein
MNDNSRIQGTSSSALSDLGDLHGEFHDVRATPARIVGVLFGVAGLGLLAWGLLPGWHELAGFSAFVIMVGTGAFLLGTWRHYNRVMVYTGGLLHRERGTNTYILWRDIDVIEAKQEERHGRIGLIPYVTYPRSCTILPKNGVWVQVYLPPLSAEAFRTLQASWERRGFMLRGAHTPELPIVDDAFAGVPPVFCPRCTAILQPWVDGIRVLTCPHCGKQVPG